MFRKLFLWVNRITEWALGYFNILSFIFIIACVVCFLFVSTSETSINQFGMVLQLFGIVLALNELYNTRKIFGHKSIYYIFLDCFKNFPKFNRDIIINASPACMNFQTNFGSVVAYSRVKFDPESSVDVKLGAILTILDQVYVELAKQDMAIADLKRKHSGLLNQTASDLNNTQEKLRSEIEYALTNDILDAIFGLVLLAIGVILTTLSSKLVLLSF